MSVPAYQRLKAYLDDPPARRVQLWDARHPDWHRPPDDPDWPPIVTSEPAMDAVIHKLSMSANMVAAIVVCEMLLPAWDEWRHGKELRLGIDPRQALEVAREWVGGDPERSDLMHPFELAPRLAGAGISVPRPGLAHELFGLVATTLKVTTWGERRAPMYAGSVMRDRFGERSWVGRTDHWAEADEWWRRFRCHLAVRDPETVQLQWSGEEDVELAARSAVRSRDERGLTAEQRADRTRAALTGLAFGDALGALAGPIDLDRLRTDWPTDDDPVPVTANTQMALAVCAALIRAIRFDGAITPDNLRGSLIGAFAEWADNTDDSRSPDATTLATCRALPDSDSWIDATPDVNHSIAAVRALPVGLLHANRRGFSRSDVNGVAQLQAALTHGHATALVAADLAANACAMLLTGDVRGLPGTLRSYLMNSISYSAPWLEDLWTARGAPESSAWFQIGRAAVRNAPASPEPTTADGALLAGIDCLREFPDDAIAALHLAATRGSAVASITGALLGTRFGMAAWPWQWQVRIEYRDVIEAAARELAEM